MAQAPTNDDGARDWVPESFRGNDAVNGFETIDDVFNAALNPPKVKWQDLVNEDVREQVAEADINEIVSAHINRPSIPADPSEYQVGDEVAEAAHEVVKKWAYENKLTQDQLTNALKFSREQSTASQRAAEATRLEGLKKLETEWGPETYKENVSLAQRVVRQFEAKVPGLGEFLKTSRAGNEPIVVRVLSEIGKVLAEDGFLESMPTDTPVKKSLAERLYPNYNAGA